MELKREEAENIMNMLLSTDEDNSYVAFQAIEAHKFTAKTKGYLIYFYKFARYTGAEWEENAPKAYKMLDKMFDTETMLTYGKGIALMISLKTNKDIIELYLERHVKELAKMLESMGYPIEHLDIELKLK